MHLTTRHSASSYGQPVLVSGTTAYGPADVLPDGLTAAAYVQAHPALGTRTQRERFLRLARLTSIEPPTK